MRIILNSDVLHMDRLLAAGLAKHIDEFCREAAQSGAVLVLPRTVILENERHQLKLYSEAVDKLKDASSLLAKSGVIIPPFTAEDLVRKVDLLTALQATGITVEVQAATFDDYRDAEYRASRHLAPQSPEAETDEMRDLVIWAIALRIALQDGGAMLVSRDKIHWDGRGLDEAASVGLLRAKTFDDALDHLGRLNPASALARSVLATIWSELRAAGLPLPDDVPSRRFSNLQFSADGEGHADDTRLSFEMTMAEGRLSGDAHIFQATPSTIQVNLTSLALKGRPWRTGSLSFTAYHRLPKITSPAADRMADLRNIIEGRQ
jgi:hypothetical protein